MVNPALDSYILICPAASQLPGLTLSPMKIKLIVSAAGILFSYLLFSFVFYSFNPANWDASYTSALIGRSIFVFFVIVIIHNAFIRKEPNSTDSRPFTWFVLAEYIEAVNERYNRTETQGGVNSLSRVLNRKDVTTDQEIYDIIRRYNKTGIACTNAEARA